MDTRDVCNPVHLSYGGYANGGGEPTAKLAVEVGMGSGRFVGGTGEICKLSRRARLTDGATVVAGQLFVTVIYIPGILVPGMPKLV